jgi:DAHP synthetase I family
MFIIFYRSLVRRLDGKVSLTIQTSMVLLKSTRVFALHDSCSVISRTLASQLGPSFSIPSHRNTLRIVRRQLTLALPTTNWLSSDVLGSNRGQNDGVATSSGTRLGNLFSYRVQKWDGWQVRSYDSGPQFLSHILSVTVAIDAMSSSSNPHAFMGVTEQGLAAIVKTRGNKDVHVVLRGGTKGPNYSSEHVKEATKNILKKREWASIMIDCSRKQPHGDIGIHRADDTRNRRKLAKESQ